MTPSDIGRELVRRLEAAGARSPGQMRDEAYAVLAAAGVDVAALVADARQELIAERRSRLERLALVRRLIADRIRLGRLAPEKAAEAKAKLARLPADIKAQKAALRRLEARPAPPQPPSAPTRELVRQYGYAPRVRDREPDGTPLSAPRYEFEWAIDRAAVPLTAEEYQAAVRLREAYLRRQNTPRVADWSGAGGGVPGPRLPARDAQLRASQDYNAVWFRLPPPVRLIVSNFVFEAPPRGRERCLDAVEFGRLYGQTRDPNRARGVTVGAIRAALAMVAELHREYDRWRAERERDRRGRS
jgi:hypothetical protein